MDGDGDGHENDPTKDPEEPIDEQTLKAAEDAADAQAVANLSNAEAAALGITGSHADASGGIDKINKGLDPGTLLPPTDPTGGAGAGAGAGSSGGDGSSSSGKASLPETFDDYLAVFMADLDKRISGDDTAATIARRQAEVEAFTERYRLSQGIDPETDDIDSIDGYLRDYRVYTDEAQVARNSLRMDLTEGDRKNAMFSQVASELPTAGLTSSQLKIETEHVLEISIVSHMLMNPKFIEKATARFGENYMLQGNATDIPTLTALAQTLKQPANLVSNTSAYFNGKKRDFFKGNKVLDDDVMDYLEERSAVQGPWITDLAQNHPNAFVRFVYEELSQTRFAKGGWGQLLYGIWWVPLSRSANPAKGTKGS